MGEAASTAAEAAGRLPLVPSDSEDVALAAVFDVFRSGAGGAGAYRSLGNAPAMLQGWVDFAWPLRNEARTSRRLRELIIMRVAQLTGSRLRVACPLRHGGRPGRPRRRPWS